MIYKTLIGILLVLFAAPAFGAGVGRFDSVGGTYDENTALNISTQMYYQARARSMMTALGSTKGGVNQMGAFDGGASLQSVISRKEITQGDMVRFTMEDNVKGKVTYGDTAVRAGGFLAYKNKECRVNNIDTPAIQVPGEMSQLRVKGSITDIPAAVRRQVIDFLNDQDEYEFIPALLNGASPGLLKDPSDGGLGVSLGNGSGGGAGVALMNKWFYTPDTSFCAYSTTPATYNSTVNDAVNGIDAAATDMVTLAALDVIRAKLDDIYFEPVDLLGRRVKAAAACDPAVMWRIKGLFSEWNKYAMPRGADNPLWSTKDIILYNEIAYFAWPNLRKYRPAYNAATGVPDFGPVTADADPRTYTNTSTNGLIAFMGADAVLEGYNAAIEVYPEEGRFKKSLEYSARKKVGYMRGEWYCKDGRAASVDNTENRSLVLAAFHEPGVGVTP